MLLGSGHCADTLLTEPLPCTRFLDLNSFSPAFTWHVNSSPYYCRFVFAVKTEFQNLWKRRALLIKSKHLEKWQAGVCCNGTSRGSGNICSQLRAVCWAAWDELLDVAHTGSVWLLPAESFEPHSATAWLPCQWELPLCLAFTQTSSHWSQILSQIREISFLVSRVTVISCSSTEAKRDLKHSTVS